MEKKKHYCYTKFTPQIISSAWEKIEGFLDKKNKDEPSIQFTVEFENETWRHDSESEFYADYIKDPKYAYYYKRLFSINFSLTISYHRPCIDITVESPNRSEIENIFQIFENNKEKCLLPKDTKPSEKEQIIFIGHGQSAQWRDLKDHLQDKHGYNVEAYEVGARAGHAIRDILEEMMKKSSLAILVLTGEDKDVDGKFHARDNVIHELGLFQGKIGFSKTIILLEEDTYEFSNIHGIHQIRYSKNNIKETFGEVLATIKRESID